MPLPEELLVLLELVGLVPQGFVAGTHTLAGLPSTVETAVHAWPGAHV
jgi:hypothetical protein